MNEVYISTSRRKQAFHVNEDCGHLQKCKNYRSVTMDVLKTMGLSECPNCCD